MKPDFDPVGLTERDEGWLEGYQHALQDKEYVDERNQLVPMAYKMARDKVLTTHEPIHAVFFGIMDQLVQQAGIKRVK